MKVDFFLILVFLLIVVSVIMAVYNRRTNKNTLYLAAFMIILGTEALTSWFFYDYTSSFGLALLLNHIAPLWTLKAPLLYFFIRGNIRDNYRLNASDFMHFLPALVHLVLIIPYISLPFADKLEIATFLKLNPHLYVSADLSYPYPHVWNQYFRSVQLIVYTLMSVFLILGFMKRTHDITGQLRDLYRFSASWLVGLLVVLLLVGMLQLLMISQTNLIDDPAIAFTNAKRIFHAGLVVYVLVPFILIVYPKFLYGFPSFRVGKLQNSTFSTVVHEDKNEMRLSSSHVFQNLDSLFDDICKLIVDNGLFLNPDLKIADLSLLLNVPPHHVQLCISIKAEKSFQEFVNDFRIQYVISLVSDSKTSISLKSLIEKSGFSSESSFKEAYFKSTGNMFVN